MENIKDLIKETVDECIKELSKRHMIQDDDTAAYSDVSNLLMDYYKNGKKDNALTYTIYSKRFDPYFRIIPMFYEEGRTLEDIKNTLGVDISTVVRNKKRLCLEIYQEII